jgi:anion-transporting  ArsA/GET3 family ATPase
MKHLNKLIEAHRIIVCVGSGGVGKTTTSAAIALHAACSGRRALVLTIDPAKRLANSLGLKSLNHTAAQIDLNALTNRDDCNPEGELCAMMLDMKEGFDDLVKNHCHPNESQRILTNRLYKRFSTSLAGALEYAAVERLYTLYQDERYDLIVLDTPPTQHALDFLDAPNRLHAALENSALQWLYQPALATGKVSLGLLRLGARGLRKILSKLTGGDLLNDIAEFLEALSPLYEGIVSRSQTVSALLHSDKSAFLVITSPDPMTLKDARLFEEKLKEMGLLLGGIIVNRVHVSPLHGEETEQIAISINQTINLILEEPPDPAFTEVLVKNAMDFARLASGDLKAIAALNDTSQTQISTVPLYDTDIHNIEGLLQIRRDIFSP